MIIASLSAKINEYVQHAQALCSGRSAQQIEGDWRAVLALERVMEVLGEVVKFAGAAKHC